MAHLDNSLSVPNGHDSWLTQEKHCINRLKRMR